MKKIVLFLSTLYLTASLYSVAFANSDASQVEMAQDTDEEFCTDTVPRKGYNIPFLDANVYLQLKTEMEYTTTIDFFIAHSLIRSYRKIYLIIAQQKNSIEVLKILTDYIVMIGEIINTSNKRVYDNMFHRILCDVDPAACDEFYKDYAFIKNIQKQINRAGNTNSRTSNNLNFFTQSSIEIDSVIKIKKKILEYFTLNETDFFNLQVIHNSSKTSRHDISKNEKKLLENVNLGYLYSLAYLHSYKRVFKVISQHKDAIDIIFEYKTQPQPAVNGVAIYSAQLKYLGSFIIEGEENYNKDLYEFLCKQAPKICQQFADDYPDIDKLVFAINDSYQPLSNKQLTKNEVRTSIDSSISRLIE